MAHRLLWWVLWFVLTVTLLFTISGHTIGRLYTTELLSKRLNSSDSVGPKPNVGTPQRNLDDEEEEEPEHQNEASGRGW